MMQPPVQCSMRETMLLSGNLKSGLPFGCIPGTPFRLRQSGKQRKHAAPAPQPLPDNEVLEHSRLCCAICLHSITSVAAGIAPQGQHEHHCTNPHGFKFLIACYASANGCRNTGDWVSEYSWFAGYLWRYALCAACHTHLGWQFKSDQDAFYGLIKARLVSYPALH